MKKTIAVFMTLLMLFGFASCKNESTADETTAASYTQQTEAENVTVDNGKAGISADDVTELATETTASAETTAENLPLEADPSKWTDEEIVAFYKAAAIRSKTKVKSTEYKNLREMVVNDGDGFLGTLVEMVTPILVSALEDSQVEFDGITGGYENLELSDTQSVRAYKSGKYTVVEMTMKDQIDGAHGERYSGTVGHAISVVGDLAEVEKALPMLEIGFDEAVFRLHYKNAKLKVKINENGIIEKGTWSYEIYITAANLYVGGRRLPLSATVESGYGTVDYVITVGGGF
ncbi:MAG: hypothetical protein IJE48_01015 [Clostridia bacterium]|nr:hypothetical protein [Clostridia bacterium]